MQNSYNQETDNHSSLKEGKRVVLNVNIKPVISYVIYVQETVSTESNPNLTTVNTTTTPPPPPHFPRLHPTPRANKAHINDKKAG